MNQFIFYSVLKQSTLNFHLVFHDQFFQIPDYFSESCRALICAWLHAFICKDVEVGSSLSFGIAVAGKTVVRTVH